MPSFLKGLSRKLFDFALGKARLRFVQSPAALVLQHQDLQVFCKWCNSSIADGLISNSCCGLGCKRDRCDIRTGRSVLRVVSVMKAEISCLWLQVTLVPEDCDDLGFLPSLDCPNRPSYLQRYLRVVRSLCCSLELNFTFCLDVVLEVGCLLRQTQCPSSKSKLFCHRATMLELELIELFGSRDFLVNPA